MTGTSGSGSGGTGPTPGPGELFGGSGGPPGPTHEDFDVAGLGRGRRILKWTAAIGAILSLGVGIYMGLPSLKGAFAPGKAAVATATAVPASGEAAKPPKEGGEATTQGPAVAQGPAVPAPAVPALKAAPATVTEVVLNCIYGANSAVTCSGTLPQPLDEVVEWLPSEQQEPAPAPGKALLVVKTNDGKMYRAADIVAIDEGQEGTLGDVKFVLASAQ